MAYPEKIQKLVDTIPVEHHKAIQKIINYYYCSGVQTVQVLLESIVNIPAEHINEYGVYNDDDLDGG